MSASVYIFPNHFSPIALSFVALKNWKFDKVYAEYSMYEALVRERSPSFFSYKNDTYRHTRNYYEIIAQI
jgi:hypothetical protein